MKIRISLACVVALSALVAAPVLAQSSVPRPKPTWRAVGTGGFNASKVKASDLKSTGAFDRTISHTKVRVDTVKTRPAPGVKVFAKSRYTTQASGAFNGSVQSIRKAAQSRPIKFIPSYKYRPQGVR